MGFDIKLKTFCCGKRGGRALRGPAFYGAEQREIASTKKRQRQSRIPGKVMVKLQFDNNKQYKVTLPKALIEAKGWGKGTDLLVVLDDKGNIVLKPKEVEK